MTSELARTGNTGLAAFEPQNFSDLVKLAEMAAKSRLFGVQSAEAAVVVMLTGASLGLPPIAAMRGIHVVQGKAVLSSDLLVAVVLRSGQCARWTPVEVTAEKCTLETLRKGQAEPVRYTWTIEMAKRAQLAGKGTWAAYPAAMLRARCSAELARMVYPDVLFGVYVEGEIDGSDTDEPRTPTPRDGMPAARPVLPPGIEADNARRADRNAAARVDVETLRAASPEVADDSERDAIAQETAPTPAEMPVELARYYERVAAIELPGEAVGLWMRFRAQVGALPKPDGEAAWKALVERVRVVGKMASIDGAKRWLAKAVKDEDSRNTVGATDHQAA